MGKKNSTGIEGKQTLRQANQGHQLRNEVRQIEGLPAWAPAPTGSLAPRCGPCTSLSLSHRCPACRSSQNWVLFLSGSAPTTSLPISFPVPLHVLPFLILSVALSALRLYYLFLFVCLFISVLLIAVAFCSKDAWH